MVPTGALPVQYYPKLTVFEHPTLKKPLYLQEVFDKFACALD
jgi:hypothetical protein